MSFRKYYTEEQVKLAAATSNSIASFLKALDLQAKGSNYQTAKRLIERHDIDTSHWLGQSWARGKQLKQTESYQSPTYLKRALITERGHVCESCCNHEWLGQPITLELEHIDGDRSNNMHDNLKLLCPNCHSQTPTWRRQKKSLVAHQGVEP